MMTRSKTRKLKKDQQLKSNTTQTAVTTTTNPTATIVMDTSLPLQTTTTTLSENMDIKSITSTLSTLTGVTNIPVQKTMEADIIWGLTSIRTTETEIKEMENSFYQQLKKWNVDEEVLNLHQCTISQYVQYHPPNVTTPVVYQLNIHSVYEFISLLPVLVAKVFEDGFIVATDGQCDWKHCQLLGATCPAHLLKIPPIQVHTCHTLVPLTFVNHHFQHPRLDGNHFKFSLTATYHNLKGQPSVCVALDARYWNSSVMTIQCVVPMIFYHAVLLGYQPLIETS